MKKKLIFSGMLVCLLALGLALVGCKTDADDDSGGSGTVPVALQGNWLRDSDGTERYLVFITNAFATDSDSFADAKKDAEDYAKRGEVVTSVTADKIEYKAWGETKSISYAIAGDKLTFDGSTYTKQP